VVIAPVTVFTVARYPPLGPNEGGRFADSSLAISEKLEYEARSFLSQPQESMRGLPEDSEQTPFRFGSPASD
jgi:hypothetical protein